MLRYIRRTRKTMNIRAQQLAGEQPGHDSAEDDDENEDGMSNDL